MPRNGSGTYSLPAGNPVVTGTTISSTTQNTTMSDVASALTNSVAKDGQTTMTGNLPMGGFKLTGLSTGSAATDSANLSQVQSGVNSQLVSISGTDNILAAGSPSVASYATGARYTFVAANNNTGAATINIDSIGAKAITKYGNDPLVANDILADAEYFIVYDGTQFQLLNPSTLVISDSSISVSKLANSAFGMSMVNGYFTASVAASALTLAIKTYAGTDPTVDDPVIVLFRSSTQANGNFVIRKITSALSFTVSSGSTLGTTSAVQAKLSFLAIDNSGTVELAIVNDTTLAFLDDGSLISTTAEGGSGTADSAGVAYSTTARSNVPYRTIGQITVTEATAGTWVTAPSLLQLTTPGMLSNNAFQATFGKNQSYGSNLAGGSRFFNTNYTNTDLKPRFVSIGVTFPASSSQLTLFVDSHPVGFGGSTTSIIATQVSAIVMPGSVYNATNTSAGATGTYWHELTT